MDNEIKGFITFGPKESAITSAAVTYVPTPEQIKNIHDYFGWDFVPLGKIKDFTEDGKQEDSKC